MNCPYHHVPTFVLYWAHKLNVSSIRLLIALGSELGLFIQCRHLVVRCPSQSLLYSLEFMRGCLYVLWSWRKPQKQWEGIWGPRFSLSTTYHLTLKCKYGLWWTAFLCIYPVVHQTSGTSILLWWKEQGLWGSSDPGLKFILPFY